MDFEVLYNPVKAEGHPFEMVVLGFFYSLVAAIISYVFFLDIGSIGIVVFTVVACLPLVYNITRLESRVMYHQLNEIRLLKHHERAILALAGLFVGFLIGYLFLFVFLPPAGVHKFFSLQLESIVRVNTPTGNFYGGDTLFSIITNNIRVLLACVLFSVLFGAGAIFILSWNASVMAAAIGSTIRESVAFASGNTIQFIHVVVLNLGKYAIHGVPEIVAYFMGGLAGGLLYHAVLNKKWNNHVVMDVLFLVGIATLMLVVAGVLEVYVSPLVA